MWCSERERTEPKEERKRRRSVKRMLDDGIFATEPRAMDGKRSSFLTFFAFFYFFLQ
jgi:hypothetical protein